MPEQNESSWPTNKIVPTWGPLAEDLIKRREQSWEQYMDGAITYVEMLNFGYSTLTKEEIIEAHQFMPAFMGEVEALIEANS